MRVRAVPGLLIAVGLTAATLATTATNPAVARPDTARPAPVASPSAKLTYSKATVLVPTALANKQLRSISADGSTYVFTKRTGVLRKLKKGSVMLLEKRAVRDVTTARVTKGHFVVTTTPAAITDLIADGTVPLGSDVDWSKAFAVSGAAVPSARQAAARAGHAFTIKGKADTYDYSVTFTPSSSGMAVKITIGKSTPIDLEASITGTLSNLKSSGAIAISHGAMTHADWVAKSVAGQFKLAYSAKPISAFGLGQAGGVKVTLPAEIAVPFFVGPVPFYIGVKVAFFASAGFSGYDQSVSGSYTFDYDGNGGFSATGDGATTAQGALSGLGSILLNAADAVANGPIAFTFGAQMPELSLGMGTSGLNIAGNVTLVGQSGIATQSGCDTRKLEVLGNSGITGSFFGLSGSFYNQSLFDKSIYASYPSGCGTFPS